MSNFRLFIFCSDLPNFWYVSYKLVGKHLSIFVSLVFSSFSRNNVSKNWIEHNRVLLFLLQQRVAKKATRKRNVFLHTLFLKKKRKPVKEKIK